MKKRVTIVTILLSIFLFANAQKANGQQTMDAKLEALQKKIDTLSKLIENSQELKESPVRLSISTNFSNLKTPDTRSYYARLSFYKDGLILKSYRTKTRRNCKEVKELKINNTCKLLNIGNCDSFYCFKNFSAKKTERKNRKFFYDTTKQYAGIAKRIDVGFYLGIFRQSYLDFFETPNTTIVSEKISKINDSNFLSTKNYYRKDSSFYYTDQTGFFISPNILLYKLETKTGPNQQLFTVRANVDIEFLQSKQSNTFVSVFTDSIQKNFSTTNYDSVIDVVNINNRNKIYPIPIVNQIYKGIGFSTYYKNNAVEVLYKASFGNVRFLEDAIPNLKRNINYNTHYFSATHLSSGIRIGGEIRNLILNDKGADYERANKILYNLYIAYATDLSGLLRRFPSKF